MGSAWTERNTLTLSPEDIRMHGLPCTHMHTDKDDIIVTLKQVNLCFSFQRWIMSVIIIAVNSQCKRCPQKDFCVYVLCTQAKILDYLSLFFLFFFVKSSREVFGH